MQDKDKKAQARIVPKTSQAPDPPITLSGGSYSLRSNTPVNHEKWNQRPALSELQFTYRLIGCEPESQLYGKKKYAHSELVELIHSHKVVDKFPKAIDPWSFNPLYRIDELICWAKSAGYDDVLKKWQPEAVERGGPCWEDAGRAIKEMRDNPAIGVPRNQEQLYCYMLEPENKKNFHNCCDSLDDWLAVKKRIYRERKDNNEAITNPLEYPRFLNTP